MILGPNDPRAVRRADGRTFPSLDSAAEWVAARETAPVTYCGKCGETYSAGATARLCAAHNAERAARLAAWRAAGGNGNHYLEHEGESEL